MLSIQRLTVDGIGHSDLQFTFGTLYQMLPSVVYRQGEAFLLEVSKTEDTDITIIQYGDRNGNLLKGVPHRNPAEAAAKLIEWLSKNRGYTTDNSTST